jgi:hypothetical protein
LPGTNQILAELIQADGNTVCSETHKLINNIWNKETFPEVWKESIIVPIYKKSDKTDCSNYQGLSLLSTTYKILFNILLSRLIPYVDRIVGDHHCGFRHNWSATDQIYCIYQITGEKMRVQWDCTSAIYKIQENLLFS